jgi:hypothetical protein
MIALAAAKTVDGPAERTLRRASFRGALAAALVISN